MMSSFGIDFALVIAILFVTVTIYFKWVFSYWKSKGIPQLSPSIPFGDAENPFKAKVGIALRQKQIYDAFKSMGHKHGGYYVSLKPIYMPIDPEYIKTIISKDFQHFTDHGVYYNEKSDPLSAHLFSIEGQKWKSIRAKVTPTFSSMKMKFMFGTIGACAEQLVDELDKKSSKGEPFSAKETFARFSTDVIGSCVFGVECNSFKDPDAEFRKNGRKFFTPTFLFRMKAFLALISPSFCRLINLTILSKDVSDFFLKVIRDNMSQREANGIVRKDFLQILVDLKKNKSDSLPDLTFNQLAAQAFVFFAAGFETTSTTLTFCFYELVQHSNIQRKVREEINSVLKKNGGELSYEALADMKYLGQVIDETLRKYPPAVQLHRICTQEYTIPGTDIVIEKGTKLIMSTLGLHHDPEYYPKPEVFDPERFNEENKAKRQQFTYLPFGDGPRHCIGFRFALLEVKVAVVLLLRKFEFSMNAKIRGPMELDPKSRLLGFKDDLLIDVRKISE